MKRICIYLTYDRQKIVDRYIGYILGELKTCVSYLVVVYNETEVVLGKEILEKYADEIFYRKNMGFDAGGFKDALCGLVGWEKILRYDELVLVNDSMFGPFKPMRDIFAEMDEKPVDFWGLTKHGECLREGMGYIPEHIQSFFLTVRTRMLHSSEFRNYWENIPYYSIFNTVVVEHEIKFTQYFADLGYTYDVLAHTEMNDSKNIYNNHMQYQTLSYELIKKRNFPFLKKRQLVAETLDCQTQENVRQAVDYIEKFTDYNTDFIWSNIIRTMNVSDLQRKFHIQYMIQPKQNKTNKKNITFLIFITYMESAEYVLDILEKIDFECSIKIFSEKEYCLLDYQKQGYQCEQVSFDRVARNFAKYSDCDYVCVLHDTDMTSDVKPNCIGKSYFYNIWDNLLKDSHHVYGILEQFEKEPFLGFLASPQPNFSIYFGEYGRGWNDKFEAVNRIAGRLNLNCRISEDNAPFRITEDFWIRGEILKKLEFLKEEETVFLPYIWIYLAQDAGYYSGIVESMDYASMNEVNMQYYLQILASQIRSHCGDFRNFLELEEQLRVSALLGFCRKYSRIFVYGIGGIMEYYNDILGNIEAYLVSDGQGKPEEINEIPVKYLSEVQITSDCGIVLCMNRENQKQVIPLLKTNGIKHYFCI